MKKNNINYAKVGLGVIAGGIGFYLLSGVALMVAVAASVGVAGIKIASSRNAAVSEVGREYLAKSIQRGVSSGKIEHRDIGNRESVHYKGLTGLKLRGMAWLFDKDGSSLRQACAEESRRQNKTTSTSGSKVKDAMGYLRKDDSKVFVNPTKVNSNGWVSPQSNNKTFVGDNPTNQYGNPYNQQYNQQGNPYNQQYNQQGNPYNQQYNPYNGINNQYGNPYNQQGNLYNQQYNQQANPYNHQPNQYGQQMANGYTGPKVDTYGRPIQVDIPEQQNRYGYTSAQMNAFKGELLYKRSMNRDETPVVFKQYYPSLVGFSLEEVPRSFGYGERQNTGMTTTMISGLEHNARLKEHTLERSNDNTPNSSDKFSKRKSSAFEGKKVNIFKDKKVNIFEGKKTNAFADKKEDVTDEILGEDNAFDTVNLVKSKNQDINDPDLINSDDLFGADYSLSDSFDNVFK